MLNGSASLAMSTSLFKALPGEHDIKRHSPSILYVHVKSFVVLFCVVFWKDFNNNFSAMSEPVFLG